MIDEDDLDILEIEFYAEGAYDGRGWYYHSVEYPEEGCCGAFATYAEAAASVGSEALLRSKTVAERYAELTAQRAMLRTAWPAERGQPFPDTMERAFTEQLEWCLREMTPEEREAAK